MKNTITRVEAMNYAIESVNHAIKEYGAYAECDEELVKVLTKIRDQIAKPHTTSPEAKSKANEKRKAATAAARATLVESVAPVLREVLSHTLQGLTAKEIFSEAQNRLPEDFTAPKVQNILLREMRSELDIVEAKGKANLYRLASVVNE